MRSSKLVLAVAAIATASLALLPAGAPAAKGARHAAKKQQTIHNGNCRLRIQAAPRFVQAGEAAVVSGTLLCSPQTTVSGQTVTIRNATHNGSLAAGAATTSVGFQVSRPNGNTALPSGYTCA